MSHPITLSSLNPRDAVADALYRAATGFDVNDLALFESALVKDVTFDMNGNVSSGFDAVKELFDFIGPLDTTHHISNVRVDLKDGADTASMTAYALAQHYKAGEGLDPASKRLTSGGIYFIDLVKDGSDGLWKIKKWVVKFVWLEGDMSIVTR